MNVDPALQLAYSSIEFPGVADLPVKKGGVYIFDFDGVVTDRTEDDIYKLPKQPDETRLFRETECRLGVDFSRLDHHYRRHLLFQTAAWHIRLPVEKGIGFEKAKNASSIGPFFILTARSGWYAVERQRKFIAENDFRPIDCYNVGRVRKDRQIAMLALEFDSSPLYYVDDSPAHCEIVAKLGIENVNVHICEELRSKRDPAQVYREVMEQFLSLE